MRTGGEGGIRTHEPREGSPVFESDGPRDNGTQARVTSLLPINLRYCRLPGKSDQARPVQLACSLEIGDYCGSARIAKRPASTGPDNAGNGCTPMAVAIRTRSPRDKNGRLDLTYIRIYTI